MSGDYSLVLAKIDSLAKKIEGLSTSTFTTHSIYMVQAPPICDTCGSILEFKFPLMSSGFTSIKQVRYAQNFQCQGNNPYSQMYNVDWQDHHNLSNENSQNVLRPREKNERWEEAIVKLVNH